MLPPPCFTVGMVLVWWWVVPGFLQTWRLTFRLKSSIFVSSDQRILSFRCILANSRWAAICLLLRSGFRLSGWTIGFLALLPQSLSLEGRPALGRVLVVPNFFITDDGGFFSVPFPRFVPQNSPVSEVYRHFLWLHAWFVLWHALSTVGPYIEVCAFPNHVQSTKFTTGGLQLSCRNISRMISGNRMHQSSILSFMAKAVNTYVHVIS